MRAAFAIATLACLLLAGCSGGGGKEEDPEGPESVQDVEVSATKGAIRGVVIDETITPIAGAVIAITGLAATATSADDGGFVVVDLEPGSYFVSASKPGYQTIQTSVEVAAGVEPPLTRISLPRIIGEQPYANTQQWSGFTQCAVSGSVFFVQACGPLDSRFIHYFSIDSIPTFMQAEMHWTSTQALTPKLQLNFYIDGTTSEWKSVAGVSPLLMTATGEEFVDGNADGANATDNPMRVSPPYLQCDSGVTNPASCDPQTVVIVNINQAYEVFLTQFYGFTPREGWLFAVDGPCTAPEQCGGERLPPPDA